MAEKRYNIVFSGKLAEGSKPGEVLKKLCPVLGLDEAQVRELFRPGAGALIGKNLDGRSVYELRDKIQALGVICSVKETESAAAPNTNFSAMQDPRPAGDRETTYSAARERTPV